MAVLILLLSSSLCMFLLSILMKFLYKVWWTPTRIQFIMRAQGIKGPSYKFFIGNIIEILTMIKEVTNKPMDLSHDIFPRIHPHIYSWMSTYGMNFLYWRGPQAELVVTDSEMIKAILNNNDGAFVKAEIPDYAKMLVGGGILTSSGEKWKKLRKLANPAFHGEILKDMVPAMIASTEIMLERWKDHEGKEIEVVKEFGLLTSEVISRTAFGTNYLKGNDVLDMFTKLGVIVSRNTYKIRLPFIRKVFKNGEDIEAEKLDKGIRDSIRAMVDNRKTMVQTGELDSYGNDFLGLLITAKQDADKNKRITMEDLTDMFKTFYVAGSETTHSHLTWTTLLLAIHTDWQEKARKEVLNLFGQQKPTSVGIARLNTVTMIINESLRLYPPVAQINRKVEREIRVGKLVLPANLNLFIPALGLHTDPNTWGKDSHLFKPERFSEGVAKATENNMAAFLPFSFGPRTCIGYNFVHNETKIALSMILQRYRFTLSPSYVHSPHQQLSLQPRHGLQIILHAVKGAD